jgi:excinuclease ABC subunit B
MPGDGKRSRSQDATRRLVEGIDALPGAELERLIRTLEDEMNDASAELRFEYAARLRDEIKDLKRELRDAG